MLAKIKRAWLSLTVWFNGIILLCMPFLDTIMQTVRDNLPTVAQWLSSDILKNAAIFILIANIVLRFKTKNDLKDK